MHVRAFVNGVLVGILLGVLFAPDSGEETRRKISRRAAGLKDTYDDLADNVSNTYNKVKTKANDLLNRGETALDDMEDEADSMYRH
jgi:gas vesicle protein